MRKIVTKTIIPALATSQIGELRHAAVVCVRPTVVLVPACRSGGGGVRAEGSGVPAVGGGRVGAVGEIVAVLHARGAVHGQHVHQPTPLRLQLLDLSLQVLVLIFQHFGLLKEKRVLKLNSFFFDSYQGLSFGNPSIFKSLKHCNLLSFPLRCLLCPPEASVVVIYSTQTHLQ